MGGASKSLGTDTFSLRSLLIFVTVVGIMLGALVGLARLRRTWDIVAPPSWPRELQELAMEARAAGDEMADIEVRHGGGIITYYWKLPATPARLERHVRQLELQAVPPRGVEEAALREWFPTAWRPPSDKVDVYAFPPGNSHPPEGEYLFVLLHDKRNQWLYFFYNFDF
jgi:hypothetical protein